jgi:hypothetical protein
LVGSLVQLPMALVFGTKAVSAFPDNLSEHFFGLAFMHVACAVALMCSWLFYGTRLGFQRSTLLNALLVLIGLAPFFPAVAGWRG